MVLHYIRVNCFWREVTTYESLSRRVVLSAEKMPIVDGKFFQCQYRCFKTGALLCRMVVSANCAGR